MFAVTAYRARTSISPSTPGITEIQAGTYVLMDRFHSNIEGGFEPALRVLATVANRAYDHLVVDDEATITDLVATALRYEGFDVEVASNGTDALRSAETFRPDLVCLAAKHNDVLVGFEYEPAIGAAVYVVTRPWTSVNVEPSVTR